MYGDGCVFVGSGQLHYLILKRNDIVEHAAHIAILIQLHELVLEVLKGGGIMVGDGLPQVFSEVGDNIADLIFLRLC